MIRDSVRSLASFVPGLQRTFVVLVVTSAVAGFAEAGVLVAVVRAAIALTSDELQPATVPLVGWELSDGSLLALAMGLGVLTMCMHLVEARITARLVSGVIGGAREASIDRFLRAGWHRQSLDREGALQEAATTLTGQSAALLLTIANIATATVNLIALLSVALVVDPISTLVVVAFGAGLFLALRPIARLTQQRASEWVAAGIAFAEELTSTSGLALELRVFGRQNEAQTRLGNLNQRATLAMRRMRVASSFGSSLYRDLALLLLVGAVAILHFFVDGGVIGVGTIALLVLRSIASAQRLQSNLQSANEQVPGLATLTQRLDDLESAAEPVRTTRLHRVGRIEFHSVDYAYDSTRTALESIALGIEPGEAIGVVGPSGSGKTTLAQILLRLRRPTAGSVTVDGVDYDLVADADWTRLTALVPQEPRLIEATIADNIRFFRPDADDEAIRRAAAAAHVLGDIEALPAGFDTVLGPRGGGLSGGQRQRLTIARAMLGAPELLVLDEPSSALDVQSERLLAATIADLRGSTTLFIVAHRLTTLKSCDRIVVMTRGRIERVGTSAELLSIPGFYRSIAGALVDDDPIEPGGDEPSLPIGPPA